MPIPGLPYTDKELFLVTNFCVPAWILLAVAPKWNVTQGITLLTSAIMSLFYGLLMFNVMTSPDASNMDFATWEGVAKLLSTSDVVLPAWVHYVAFDLWTGRWIALDAADRGIPRLLMAPILFFTLMLGPVGFLVYISLRVFFVPKEESGIRRKAKAA